MNTRKRFTAALMTLGLLAGGGVALADSASAAPAFTPVCHYKKVVKRSGLFATKTYTNIVKSSYVPPYSPHSKVCNVEQREYWDRVTGPDIEKVIYRGKVIVRI